MNRFIEVLESDGKTRILCPVCDILFVIEDHGKAVICLFRSKFGKYRGIITGESYDVVKEKIENVLKREN